MMSDWESTRQFCMKKLEVGLKLYEVTVEMSRISTNFIQDENLKNDIGRLSKIRTQINDEYQRLKRNQFEVAVIGLEKAGKSTLLNGWLGADILPNLDERCTYTTTEIRSATLENQKIEIEYFSKEEFERDFKAKQETRLQFESSQTATGRTYDEIVQEINDIEKNKHIIESLLERPIETQKFTDFHEIKEVLRKNIADPAHARAVKRLVIHTPKLLSKKDVIFYDVPGFNSPVKLHREQAEARLRSVDIVLYAKQFETPSLTGDETSILDKNDLIDPYVKVGEKFFVALTRIDSAKTQDRYSDLLNKAYVEWNGKSQVPKERILPVCPPLEIQDFDPNLKKRISEDLQICNGGQSGMAVLKTAIDQYIETKRAQVVHGRCEQVIQSLREIAQPLLIIGQENSPSSLEELELTKRDYEDSQLMPWWAKEWERIKERFVEVLNEKYFPKHQNNPDAEATVHESLNQFKQKFDQHIAVLFEQINAKITDEKLLNLYRLRAADRNIVNPKVGHQEIRDYVFNEIILILDELSVELATELVSVIKELLNVMNQLMWGCLLQSQLKKQVLHAFFEGNIKDLQQRLHIGLNVLLVRLARPAANLFLKFERSDRKQLLMSYRIETIMMDYFYKGDTKTRKGLVHFLSEGAFKTMPEKAGISDFDPNQLKYAPPTEKFEEVKVQVRKDLEVFQDYLKNSVYYAAGLEAFSTQELDRVRRKFIDYEEKEHGWQRIVLSALRSGHLIKGAPILVDIMSNRKRLIQATESLKTLLDQLNQV